MKIESTCYELMRGWIVSLLLMAGMATHAIAQEVAVAEWNVVYDSGGLDDGRSIAVDPISGSVYVTGSVNIIPANSDIQTMKIGTDGVVVWNKRFDSGGVETGYDVAVDVNGNVYVIGTTNIGVLYDFLTIKYDADGNVVWSRRYDSTGSDNARGIAVDVSGNVIVTGNSTISFSYNDVRIIKYDSAGNTVWNKRYSTGNSDASEDIAVDGSGNIYIGGHTFDGSGQTFYLTIKIDPSGNVIWSRLFDFGGNDAGKGVAVDGSGNVYITGSSSLAGPRTLKYDSNGNIVLNLASSFVFPDSIAIDATDNIYITGNDGYSNGSGTFDFMTIKYDASGSEIWRATFNSGSNDIAYGVALDNSGSVYVAGVADNDFKVIKYSQITVINSAVLAATISVSGASTVFRENELIEVVSQVANTGVNMATDVAPLASLGTNASVFSKVSGPSPAVAVSLSPGAAQLFTWTYKAISPGVADFTVTVTGNDLTAGLTLNDNATTVRIAVIASAFLDTSLSVMPQSPQVGERLTVIYTISNSGSLAASGVEVYPVTLSDVLQGVIVSGPQLPTGPFTLVSGDSRTIQWQIDLLTAGTIALSVSSTGMDSNGIISAIAFGMAEVVRRFDENIVIYPNPVSGDSVTVNLKLSQAARELVVTVYNVGYSRVYEGVWRNFSSQSGEIVINGLSNWAPGFYVIRINATLMDGNEQVLPIVKLVVKR